ncbi:hypothetical protein EIN_335700 [Entamoeba invadens IP1]|uniref:Leucine rich repeat containing protein BspA family protein n=1 Tax=Entamoeba invadens IP1 TaxID=370355 RepID=L7FLD4_ENTIV|nr:hypothetical protein EIN_335700 [Entamoeba invadens IP1]ELP88578.1 hypothetical protein EIN_335700 [Entamoeba invadens IP1]|eukprot:XP_004255349.1 hypothetical protein EIN_335700 [Entamoeba invadens IP1]
MTIAKYFSSYNDYSNLVIVCKKFSNLPQMFHFNPIPLTSSTQKLFKNIETQILYQTFDPIFDDLFHYHFSYQINFQDALDFLKKHNATFSRVFVQSSKILQFLKDSKKQLTKTSVIKIQDSKLIGLSNDEHEKEDVVIKTHVIDPSDFFIVLQNGCFSGKYSPSKIKKVTAIDYKVIEINSTVFNSLNSLSSIKTCYLTSMKDYCFCRLPSLKELDLSNVVKMGENCVCHCDNLTTLTLMKESECQFGNNCFMWLDRLQKVVKNKTEKINGKMSVINARPFLEAKVTIGEVFVENRDFLENEIIPEIATEIKNGFLANCKTKTLVIPNTIKKIEVGAFDCNLVELDLSHFKNFDYNFFTKNTTITKLRLYDLHVIEVLDIFKLKALKVLDVVNLDKSSKNCEISCSIFEILLKQPLNHGKIVFNPFDRKKHENDIPPFVEKINTDSFTKNSLFSKLIIPPSVTSIEKNSFERLDFLTSLEFANTPLFIDKDNFMSLPLLQSVDLKNVIFLGEKCFSSCNSLTSVTLCRDLPHIPTSFSHLPSLRKIFVDAKEYVGDVSYSVARTIGETCGCHCCNVFLLSEESKKMCDIPKGIIELRESCFMRREDIKRIEFPESVRIVRQRCFVGCLNLEEVGLDEKLEEVAQDAFLGCLNIKTIRGNPQIAEVIKYKNL